MGIPLTPPPDTTTLLSASRTSLAGEKDILQVLLEGHQRIRRFTALAVQLGHAQGASLAELSETASRVLHYFTHELPLHLEEEDQGLLPRLFTTQLPLELVSQLWELENQHDECERLLQQLVPLWTIVRDTPERHPALAERLARGSSLLLMAMEEHVKVEEQVIFPFVRACFPHETLVELATELLRRRLGGWREPLREQVRVRAEVSPASELSP